MPKSVKKQPKKQKPKASAKPKEKPKETEKSDFEGFRGGLSVKLDRKLKNKQSLRDVLSLHLTEVLDQELRNQSGRVDELLPELEDLYKGKKKPKDFPFDKASNVSSLLSRSNTDQLFVRLYNTVHGRKKVVMITANKEEYVGLDRKIENAFNYFLRNELKFKEKMFDPLMECVKTGTGIIKVWWKEDRNTVYDVASEEEEKNEHTYALQGTDAKAIKLVETSYVGPCVYGIKRKDFIISSDAKTIQDAYLCGFKREYRLPQLMTKTRQMDNFDNPIYDPKQVEKITQPDEHDDQDEVQAERQGKEMNRVDATRPYEIWELWLNYDVDEDGEEDSIVVTFHRQTGTILRCIYNPLFRAFRPFVDFKFYPVEYMFDGEGVCEILQPIENALDTIINQRIDAGTLQNAPPMFVRNGIGLNNYKLAPGKAFPVDGDIGEESIRIVQFPGPPMQTFQEEDRMIARGDRTIGIAPEMMGLSTSDRPVFKEAATKLQEAGRKFQAGFNHVWSKFTETFYMLLYMFAQYQPHYIYTEKDGTSFEEQAVDFPTRLIEQSLNIEVAAASELMNQDERLQRSLTLFTLLSDYMTKMATMGQYLTDPTTPVAFKQIILDGNDISVRILRMILDDFDVKNIDELILDMRESLGEEGVRMVMQLSSMGMEPPPGEEPPPEEMPPQ